MGVGILAPVPAVHLKSALDTCAAAGRVAFGSDAWEVLQRAGKNYGEGISVLIYPTHHHGDPDRLSDPGYVNFRGVFHGITMAHGGKHPDPTIRPRTTIEGRSSDTAWAMFWEVSDLVHLSKEDRIAITDLTAERAHKPFVKGFVPLGPMLVKADFL
jgi:hypothetical protein